MQTRKERGCYASHNTPGDGTGFSRVPSPDYRDVLTDVESEARVSDQPYPAMRKSMPEKGRSDAESR